MQFQQALAAVTRVQGDLPAWQDAAYRLLAQLPRSPAPASPALLFANIVAGKGEVAGRHTLMQLGMTAAAAAAILHSPALQATVKCIQTFYEDPQVGAVCLFMWYPRPEIYVITYQSSLACRCRQPMRFAHWS
jgi:hypothetical protein